MAALNPEKPLSVLQCHCGRQTGKHGRNWNGDWDMKMGLLQFYFAIRKEHPGIKFFNLLTYVTVIHLTNVSGGNLFKIGKS